MSGGNVEIEVGQFRGDLRQKAGTIQSFQLDHGKALGQIVRNLDARGHVERFQPIAATRALRAFAVLDQLRQATLAHEHGLDELHDTPRTTLLVRVTTKGPVQGYDIQRAAVRQRVDLRVHDVAASRRAGSRQDGEQTGVIVAHEGDARCALERARTHVGHEFIARSSAHHARQP